ncbi:hypothetical protein Ga0100231_017250 [Opitutaceae bacterium TAV4]|nr:hypothetical protein Ga0100231_017250 [Opitutaceae bacterium TAV4]RRJ99244.1 hypothetical protein Ga0100230_013610 [Opitutaceae bacterium TAV3]
MKQYLKTAGLAAALAAVASIPVSAEVAIKTVGQDPNKLDNDLQLFVDGYAAVAGTITHVSGTNTNDGSLFDSGDSGYDQVKFGIRGQYKDFGGYASFLYTPGADDEAGILDLYVNWSQGGLTVTVGKFLSNLGYESFYAINTDFISYALVAMPGYHSGVKADYVVNDTLTAGVAVVDSVWPGSGFGDDFKQGDGNLSDLGFEAYVSYTGIEKLTVFLGAGFESSGNDTGFDSSSWTLDLWASYALTDKLTLGAELAYVEDYYSFAWLLSANYAITDKFSTAARISGIKGEHKYDEDADVNYKTSGYKFSVGPAYALTDYFSVRGELSYTKNNGGDSDVYFYGVQALFKF